MTGLPPALLAALSALPAARGASLLLRHGERGEMPVGEVGDDVPLTAAGQVQAMALGAYLGPRLGKVRTSPVLRCSQTAQALLAGAGRVAVPEPDPLLGGPGPFVMDGELAWPLFLQHGAQGLARLQLEQPTLPGLRPVPTACDLLLRAIGARPPSPGQIDLYVSHDMIIALLAAFLLGEKAPEPLWPTFLEGLLLWPEGRMLIGAYRGRELRSTEF